MDPIVALKLESFGGKQNGTQVSKTQVMLEKKPIPNLFQRESEMKKQFHRLKAGIGYPNLRAMVPLRYHILGQITEQKHTCAALISHLPQFLPNEQTSTHPASQPKGDEAPFDREHRCCPRARDKRRPWIH